MASDEGNNIWSEAVARHQQQLPREQRKRDGVWFTPLELALATAHHTLQPLRNHRNATAPLRICDPAVGGGSFLLAAATVLRTAPSVAAHFTGIDLDATATQLAAN